uniref:G-protein coupled receptors family 1 profile domain-containing protein n=2 Tax=Ciona intestinalis TaxID=7719 RepID=F6V8C7_CIOIN
MNATKFEITPTTTVLSKLNHTEYQEWNLLGQKVWTSESKATWSPNKDVAWYTCEAIHITCIVVAFYILYALVHFRILRKAEVAKTSARLRKGGRWLENLCIMGVLTALLRFGNNQALLFTVDSTSRCSTLLNVSIALYNVTIHPIYTFLWVRLRIFYSNRALKHLYSKTVRFLSWVALLCFICVTMVCMVLLIVDRDNSASGRVCANTNSNDSSTVPANSSRPPHQQGVRVNIMTGLLGGCIQLSFLALFLYPIMDNK